jgi:hypothetical protein
MSLAKEIRASWIYENEGYEYSAIPDSIVANDSSESVRFELREAEAQDENLEVVIQSKGGTYSFKTDYYQHPQEELPLKKFVSDDELVLFYDGKYGRAYFHLKF